MIVRGRPLLAFDKRTFDADGRMRVTSNPISKAAVNGYYGREIPGGAELGLEPDRLYQLLRDPAELKKAAPTFNMLPILRVHTPVSADDHPTSEVVGTTGSNCAFEHPYLKNELCVWTNWAIAAIESEEQRELSSSYRYKPVMESGEYEGVAYDGRMVDIIGNHVALVDDGRAGPDVLVGDALPREQSMKKKFSRRALAVRSVLAAYLKPRLAADKAVDLSKLPALLAMDSKNFEYQAPKVVAEVTVACKDKLAADADLKDLADAVHSMRDDEQSEDEDPDAMDEEVETEEEKAERMKRRKEAKDKAKDAEVDTVSKGAMDAAIKATETKLRADFKAVEEARIDVRPLVGDIVVAMDSAADVYRFALEQRGMTLDGVPPEAYRALVQSELRHAQAPKTVVASDRAAATETNKMFPGASRIRSA